MNQRGRLTTSDPSYRDSGNVFIDKLLGATLHSYPHGEDESGADHQLEVISAELMAAGGRPCIIPLGPGHPPLGSLVYVVAATELLHQIEESELNIDGYKAE